VAETINTQLAELYSRDSAINNMSIGVGQK
jgi:hypothetical protein